MAPQLFGIEHILYLIISTVVSSAALLVAKKYAKTEKIDMYKIIEDIFVEHNYDVNYRTLVKELNNYQNKNEVYFDYQNINVIPSMVGMVIVKRLS